MKTKLIPMAIIAVTLGVAASAHADGVTATYDQTCDHVTITVHDAPADALVILVAGSQPPYIGTSYTFPYAIDFGASVRAADGTELLGEIQHVDLGCAPAPTVAPGPSAEALPILPPTPVVATDVPPVPSFWAAVELAPPW